MAVEVRDRNRTLRVVVTPSERAGIERNAAACGMSVSAYLRALGLGRQPKPVLNRQAMDCLTSVNADQGQLGGLLNQWLAERSDEGSPAHEVRRILNEVRETQQQLTRLMAKLAAHLPDQA